MKVNFVVVDSGPIIKGAILNSFSDHAIIVPGVIKEIKDIKTRERIRNLPPYFLSIQSPTEDSIKHVRSVAAKTGDLKVLSTVDIEVLAMAYELQFSKSDDDISRMFGSLSLENNEIFEEADQFHFGNEVDLSEDESLQLSDNEKNDEQSDNVEQETDEEIAEASENFENESVEENEQDSENALEVIDATKEHNEKNVSAFTMPLSNNDGWITAENFEEMRKTNFGLEKIDNGVITIEDLEEVPRVGCLTTDYAMQNVLLHMKVTILSVGGMVVKEPRIFVSYCRTCFHKYRRVDIFFCPHCGNDTLGKVPAKISANGEMELFLKKDFRPNLRNKIFSIPTPKGGKHTDGTHYIYCADQRVPDERLKKKAVVDICENEEIPFIMNDLTSKAYVGASRGQHNMRSTVPRGNKNHNGRRRKR